MNTTMASGPGDLGWTEVAACTLPTAERPLRLAEFDDLFATGLTSIERTGDTRVRLLLGGDAAGGSALVDRTQRLADAETACCSFFTFTVTTVGPGSVALDVVVPPAYADVLAGLMTRAEATLGGAS